MGGGPSLRRSVLHSRPGARYRGLMRNPWKISTLVLAAGFATLLARDAFVTPAAADPQPKMQAALDLLNSAHAALEGATSDKGGHRVKAMKLVKSAIIQVEKGIKFDNKH